MPALLPICWVGFVIALFVILILMKNKAGERKRKEEAARKERVRKYNEETKKKYESETPARRALILQLYKEKIDLKEITFILRKANYLGITGEKITMKEIMEEHAQMQIEQHQQTLAESEQATDTRP